ncbi:MAG: transcriptional regulator [Gammaproteobacteria bacterium]|nr:transcriptional regulator [Gammaproteobacteria bacterium]MCE3238043.1 transcriptional regulator [Gammaproteobacteria bacterium]
MSNRPTLKNFKNKILKNPKSKRLYDELEPEYQLLSEMLAARDKAGMTQEAVAKRMGTNKSNISRLENSLLNHSPTFATIKKYAEAVNCHVEIHLVRDR